MIKKIIRRIKIKIFYKINRIKLKNKDVTILSNNCTAGVIYHELNLKFLSPTINLFMGHYDFTKFVNNLEEYRKSELIEIKKTDKQYPVGILKNNKCGDIRIEFMHYKSFSEAKEKWYKRFERINVKKIYVILDVGPGIDTQLMKDFYKLNTKNKIALVTKDYKGPQSFGISCYNEKWHAGQLLEFNPKTGKKYLHEWDYVKFLNNN